MHCSVLGKFELIVKRYPAWGSPSFPHNYKPPGKVSNYIHSLEVGAMVNFKHIAFNIKKQYPFTVSGPRLTQLSQHPPKSMSVSQRHDWAEQGVKTITMLAVGVGIAPMLQALHSLLKTPVCSNVIHMGATPAL
jgi:NAD(P)H-flavin reductase